jgi:hypothetical protein
MIELTGEQQHQMMNEGWPPRVVNPNTREEFVLIHAALFDRVRQTLEAEDEIPAIEEAYPAVAEVMDHEESAARESA